MTVVVGMVCADGALLAADSRATDTHGQTAFEYEKIFPLGDICLVGASGHTSIVRQVRRGLESSVPALTASPDRPVGMADLVKPHVASGYNQFVPLPGQTGVPATQFLAVGLSENGSPWLAEIDPNCMMDRFDDTLGYYAIGSGAAAAQIAMALMSHFNVTQRPLDDCKLIAYRVLDATIKTAMYGVGYPINIWTISQDAGSRQVSKGEMRQLEDMVNAWRAAENEALTAFLSKPNETPADLPPELP